MTNHTPTRPGTHNGRIRRSTQSNPARQTGVIWLDPPTGRVRVHNRDIKVPPDQFHLLKVLATEPFRTFPKEELAVKLTGTNAISRTEVRTIERIAHRLRHTLTAANVDAVLEPAGIGFQLFPLSIEKTNDAPVALKVAA